jgi:hypothetical protein
MIALSIFMNAERMGADLCGPDVEVIEADKDMSVGLLDHGMGSGRSSVSFLFELPPQDGKRRVVFAETSLALFLAAARAFSASGEPRLLPVTIQ